MKYEPGSSALSEKSGEILGRAGALIRDRVAIGRALQHWHDAGRDGFVIHGGIVKLDDASRSPTNRFAPVGRIGRHRTRRVDGLRTYDAGVRAGIHPDIRQIAENFGQRQCQPGRRHWAAAVYLVVAGVMIAHSSSNRCQSLLERARREASKFVAVMIAGTIEFPPQISLKVQLGGIRWEKT
jgi:hypothetical protein